MKHLTQRRLLCALAILAVTGSTVPAHGAIIFGTGEASGASIQFNDPGTISSGTTVSGFPSFTTDPDFLFNFIGTELLQTNSGAALIEAQDGGFTNLIIQMNHPTGAFESIGFNLQLITDTGADGLTVQVTTLEGATSSFDYGANALNNGSNKFVIFTNSPLTEHIRTVQITTTVELQDIRQIRVEGINLPEPNSMLLIGSGIALLAFRVLGKRARS